MKFQYPVLTVATLFALAGCIPGSKTTETTSVRLSWLPPIERVNGNALNGDLSGYELRYRKAGDSGNFTVVELDASYQFYTVDNLSAGQQYVFELAAIDSNGVYSAFVTAIDP